MPVYNEETFNYEILLRFGDADPNKGKLTGASRTTITQTTKDGVPIATNINPPEQLALIAGEEGEMLADVLGEVNAATIITNQELTATNQSLSANIEELQASIQSLDADLEKVHGDLTQSQSDLAAAQAEIQRLTEQLTEDAATAYGESTTQQAEIQRLTNLLATQAQADETVEQPAS